MSAAQLSKDVFPVPYQVDFISETKGRHIDSTKRKLTWKFGFAHPPAVFPHLHDADGCPPRTGIQCRGREHEIIITWSILTSKVHIYVDSKEIYRHVPYHNESILYTFNGEMHRGFDLPNAEANGRHRIDVKLYARTPMGAKNMVVDENGGTFRQFDLAVDGLSYFSMPAVFELGTVGMWEKVSRWGMARLASSRGEEDGGRPWRSASDGHHRRTGEEDGAPSFSRSAPGHHGGSEYGDGRVFSKDEYRAMHPRTESEEERMTRIATEESLKDWDKRVGYGKSSTRETSSNSHGDNRPSSRGNNRQRSGGHRTKKQNSAQNLTAIGEDNLIDFGADEAASGISHINIPERHFSDVSVMDDDATTASFMMPAQPPPPSAMRAQPPPPIGPLYNHNPQQAFQHPGPDPTFRAQYAQQPWSSVGTLSTPRNRVGGALPSDASFAVPPAPTLDDYEDAFGGSTLQGGAPVWGGPPVAGMPMSPVSAASLGMGAPMTQHYAPQQYGMQQASAPMAPQQQWQSPQQQWPSQSFAAPVAGGGVVVGGPGKSNSFDPFQADPFGS